MQTEELRQKFLNFFKTKHHQILPSASVIPENDATVLFNTAGMQPLVPYLMGQKHPLGKRLANTQKCLRTDDIEEVGDNTHLTFFEMLGNWSLGDYFRVESINWSYEFLTSSDWLNLDPKFLAVSVFAGDSDAPFDQESYDLWLDLGFKPERIAKLPKKNNWWGPVGKTGPCGPDTEIFYWTGSADDIPENFDDSDSRWVEIWNNVFMEFFKQDDGSYKLLEQKNVDTGMGLERTVAVVNGQTSVYQTSILQDLINVLPESPDPSHVYSQRVIVDHIRAATVIMSDTAKIKPSNLNQGYVVRKLIRRAIRHGRIINLDLLNYYPKFLAVLVKHYQEIFPEIANNQAEVLSELQAEHERFSKTIEKGLKILTDLITKDAVGQLENAELTFDLYQTYGFPIEMVLEELTNRQIKFNRQVIIDNFQTKLKAHQDLSRTASAGMFKGGLADHSEIVTKYHTATHLLHQALREILGSHVEQKGSNLTAERLRFDFSHGQKLTSEQIAQVEKIVNQKIQDNLSVVCQPMTVEEAKSSGAIGLFAEKYGDVVNVYSIGDYSKEICGGPHVQSTGTMGIFKIVKEEAVSSGIRRIKATLS